ncbi:MAG: MBL fold metallo-hydrolase, partial [Treponema sp.]|nr:MBL fold metallo-hydrolase [Treponema sp.]
MLSVRFWGVRGSIPCPGPDTVIYGGNTTCLEIRADDRLLIADLGTGLRSLGDWLMTNDLKKYGKIKADIFVTHTHWDHILGFPMFTPAYIRGTEL